MVHINLADWLNAGICPDCHDRTFIDGRGAGLYRKITCSGCGRKFNVARILGWVLFAQWIDAEQLAGTPDIGLGIVHQVGELRHQLDLQLRAHRRPDRSSEPPFPSSPAAQR